MSRLDNTTWMNVNFKIPDNVFSCYSEPHRKYHNVQHIEYMLNALNTITSGFSSLPMDTIRSLVWAIFYHDIVFNIPAFGISNEKLSALMFTHDHNDHLDLKRIVTAIRATETHIPTSESDLLTLYLIDLDLWALADGRVYTKNSILIQEEYGASNDEWAIGRSNWLESFLQRDQIYYTEKGMRREDDARKLMNNEFKALRS